MRHFVRAGTVAGALLVALSGTASAQSTQTPVKIAYVNSQVILQQAPGRAEAEAQFNREVGTYRQQIQRMGDSLNTLVSAYNKVEPTLSAAVKETRQKEIRAKEEDYQRREAQLQQQMQARQVALVQPIMQRINKVIDELRAEGGYAFVLDAGSSAGVVVSADKSLDMTDRVLSRLKAAAPAAAGPAKPAGAPAAAPAGVSRPKTPPGT